MDPEFSNLFAGPLLEVRQMMISNKHASLVLVHITEGLFPEKMADGSLVYIFVSAKLVIVPLCPDHRRVCLWNGISQMTNAPEQYMCMVGFNYLNRQDIFEFLSSRLGHLRPKTEKDDGSFTEKFVVSAAPGLDSVINWSSPEFRSGGDSRVRRNPAIHF